MARTFISQEQQIFNSELYSDTLAPGSALSSSAGNLEDDLNALRSVVKLHLLGSTGASGNWFDDLTIPTSGSVAGAITGSKRGLDSLNQGLYNTENKNFLYRVEVLVDVPVPAGQNWVTMSSGQEPTQTIALNDTVLGTVTARLTGTFNSWNGDFVQGANNISPKNLVMIVSASDYQAITSQAYPGHEIFGLLQVSGSATEGSSFNTTNNAAQLSFVVIAPGGTGLMAVPASDLSGMTVRYAYVARTTFTNTPEDSFLSTNFTDFSSLVDLTLATAVNSQVNPFTQNNSIDWAIASGQHFAFLSGSRTLFRFDVNGSSNLTMNVDAFNVNNTQTANFTKGASFNTGSNFINVGVTNGQIDASAGLTIKAISNLLLSGTEVTFADAFNAGSSYSGVLPLATSSGDWTSFSNEFGNVSLLAAFDKLYNSIATVSASVGGSTFGRRIATGVAVVTASLNAGVNVSTNPSHQNASGSLPSLAGIPFDSKVVVFLNGVRQYAGSANDVVPGTGLSDGDIKFPSDKLRGGTVIQVDVYN